MALLTGCATTNEKQTTDGANRFDGRPEPTLGMTKPELEKVWGKPKNVTVTPGGELWQYNNMELAYIPFNFGFKPNFYTFSFNKEGKLVDYSVTKND